MIKKRLELLRLEMKKENIDYYLIPTADFHNSEYVSDFFKKREFLSGFTGSNGMLLVGKENAGLWTDGRYFIQAETELSGSGIQLFKMLEEGVLSLEDYLKNNMKEHEILGFDGRVVDSQYGLVLENILLNNQIQIKYEFDLIERFWTDIPAMPAKDIFLMPETFNGQTFQEKANQVRNKLREKDVNGLLLSKLDDIMWLLNVRGMDVECNPVALSFVYLTFDEVYFFVQKEAITIEVENYLNKMGIQIKEYNTFYKFVENQITDKNILCDLRYTNYTTFKLLKKHTNIIKENNPTELLKARKNKTELEHMKEIYMKDSVILTKFIFWLKNTIKEKEISEIDAANYLDHLRKEIPGFICLSFPTISAYKENAAMMHYEATEEHYKLLKQEGMYLVDSGGQYFGGTTDVTRTIVLGEISEEIKQHYTLVTAGMLNLSDAKFLYGCTGRNLDILARKPLWDIGIDYKCGTGHGVGYCLNVHEGPQGIRFKYPQGALEAVLEEGMVVTNEPGVYVKDSHGIRIENVMTVNTFLKNSNGQFMNFETFTFVPIDLDGIDTSYLTKKEIELLNQYHQKVFETISPSLENDEVEWLKQATRRI